jgi:hypothetical protein
MDIILPITKEESNGCYFAEVQGVGVLKIYIFI